MAQACRVWDALLHNIQLCLQRKAHRHQHHWASNRCRRVPRPEINTTNRVSSHTGCSGRVVHWCDVLAEPTLVSTFRILAFDLVPLYWGSLNWSLFPLYILYGPSHLHKIYISQDSQHRPWGLEHGVYYLPLDMSGFAPHGAEDPMACQLLCAQQAGSEPWPGSDICGTRIALEEMDPGLPNFRHQPRLSTAFSLQHELAIAKQWRRLGGLLPGSLLPLFQYLPVAHVESVMHSCTELLLFAQSICLCRCRFWHFGAFGLVILWASQRRSECATLAGALLVEARAAAMHLSKLEQQAMHNGFKLPALAVQICSAFLSLWCHRMSTEGKAAPWHLGDHSAYAQWMLRGASPLRALPLTAIIDAVCEAGVGYADVLESSWQAGNDSCCVAPM